MMGDVILSEKNVKVICGFFRSPQNCRGYDLKTPIGKIADCAFRHHNLRDRYILELEKKLEKYESDIAELKAQVRDYAQGLYVIQSKAEKEIRHQKYNRCVAMAKLCHWKMGVFIYHKEKNEFYFRWHKRWLELSEKFK